MTQPRSDVEALLRTAREGWLREEDTKWAFLFADEVARLSERVEQAEADAKDEWARLTKQIEQLERERDAVDNVRIEAVSLIPSEIWNELPKATRHRLTLRALAPPRMQGEGR